MKLSQLGELQKLFVARGKSDVTPTMTTRSAGFDKAVRWWQYVSSKR